MDSSSYSVPSISTGSLSSGNAGTSTASRTALTNPSASRWLKAIWTYLRQINQNSTTTHYKGTGPSRWNRTRLGFGSTDPASSSSFKFKPAFLADVMATNLSQLCLPAYNVLDNHLNQNPCEVARALLDECNDNKNEPNSSRYYPLFALGPLGGTTHTYAQPAKDQVNDCICSMTTYNLIQACAACQFYALPSSTPRWATFSSNCSITDKGFARPLQDKDQIPSWAWADNSNGALNVQEALLQAVMKNAQHRSNSSSALASFPTPALAPPASSSSSSAPASPTAAATSAEMNSTSALGGYQRSGSGHGPHGTPPPIIAALVLSILFSLGLIIMIGLWTRHRRRVAAHGKRLASSDDLHRNREGSSMPDHGSSMRERERNEGVLAWLPPTTLSSQRSFSRGYEGEAEEEEEEELGSEMSYATNSVSIGGPLASERGGAGGRWLNLPYGQALGAKGRIAASTLYTTTTRSSFDSQSGTAPLSLGYGSGSRTNYSTSARDLFDDTHSSFVQDEDDSQDPRGGGNERSTLLRGSLAKPPRVIISNRDNLYHSNVETRIEEVGFYSRPRPRSLASSTGATYGLGMRSDSEGEEEDEQDEESGDEDEEGSDTEEGRSGPKGRGRKKVLDVDLISLSSGL
ncbi:BZ3500_MvSof-1268-A1-R1_Chr6-2g08481 [Microbotryum saponariae]|uniref:BZ3500_MvSof-1268-A1-R1_Chr6-2g08481 protein n=1 Tax=Microbotryum saponariae TaxID=289078 RepID=A0A2X0KHR5_9BASI|nr:BZ3500_MvSof-1268-A1-R1_Chr6-2g08481 [Microbotryum saponariae]SDA07758.1 BZ3501_MvSof-1269-A2-R1_Chr6-1g08195 [Microbotryum saponariae]